MSLLKLAEIRSNKPGLYLIHYVAMVCRFILILPILSIYNDDNFISFPCFFLSFMGHFFSKQKKKV